MMCSVSNVGKFSRVYKGSDVMLPDDFDYFYNLISNFDGYVCSDISSTTFTSKDGVKYTNFSFEVFKYVNIK